jgi:hypothetical protein
VIITFVTTILVEGMVVIIYSLVRKKPLANLFFASIIINIITQTMLWVLLLLFFHHYLLTLILVELFIWVFEGLVLSCLPGNHLSKKEAFLLSFIMNTTSLGIGWFLPF